MGEPGHLPQNLARTINKCNVPGPVRCGPVRLVNGLAQMREGLKPVQVPSSTVKTSGLYDLDQLSRAVVHC